MNNIKKHHEANIQIGTMNVNLYYSDRILNIKIEEPASGMLKFISIQQKIDCIKYIVWDKQDGILLHTTEPIDR